MSALRTSPTRGYDAATTSTARFTAAITSSHSPSMLVNIALVSVGSPESRMTRIASATGALTPPSGASAPSRGVPEGLMLTATIMRPAFQRRSDSPTRGEDGDNRGEERAVGYEGEGSMPVARWAQYAALLV